MPGYDRTGPKGMGPGSGGGFGRCGNNAAGKNTCRRKGGAGQQRGTRSGFGQGQQMRRGFGSPEELIPEEGNSGVSPFSETKWFHRRNRT